MRVIRNDENVGFGRACNQAAREARGRHLVFLNFDCEPQDGWLDALVRAADDDPRRRRGAGRDPAPGRHRQHRRQRAALPRVLVGAARRDRAHRPALRGDRRLGSRIAGAARALRRGRGLLGDDVPLLRGHGSQLAPPPRRLPRARGAGRPRAARVRVRAEHGQVLPPRAEPAADGGSELRASDPARARAGPAGDRARARRRRAARGLGAPQARGRRLRARAHGGTCAHSGHESPCCAGCPTASSRCASRAVSGRSSARASPAPAPACSPPTRASPGSPDPARSGRGRPGSAGCGSGARSRAGRRWRPPRRCRRCRSRRCPCCPSGSGAGRPPR